MVLRRTKRGATSEASRIRMKYKDDVNEAVRSFKSSAHLSDADSHGRAVCRRGRAVPVVADDAKRSVVGQNEGRVDLGLE